MRNKGGTTATDTQEQFQNLARRIARIERTIDKTQKEEVKEKKKRIQIITALWNLNKEGLQSRRFKIEQIGIAGVYILYAVIEKGTKDEYFVVNRPPTAHFKKGGYDIWRILDTEKERLT